MQYLEEILFFIKVIKDASLMVSPVKQQLIYFVHFLGHLSGSKGLYDDFQVVSHRIVSHNLPLLGPTLCSEQRDCSPLA